MRAFGLSCFSCVHLFMTLRTVAHQAPLSMGFSKQEYWTGLPFLPPGIFSTQELNLGLLHLFSTHEIKAPSLTMLGGGDNTSGGRNDSILSAWETGLGAGQGLSYESLWNNLLIKGI